MAAVVVTGAKITPVAEAWGQKRFVAFTLTTDTGDYAAGGFALPSGVTPADFGMSSYESVIVVSGGGALASGAYHAAYIPSSGKIMLFEQSDSDNAVPLAEKAASATVVVTLTVWAFGI